MYKIFHNIDGQKTTTLNSDAEFVHFMRQIAIENDDEELSITCKGEAMDYLKNYCPNLTLLDNDIAKDDDGNCLFCGDKCFEGEMCDEQQSVG